VSKVLFDLDGIKNIQELNFDEITELMTSQGNTQGAVKYDAKKIGKLMLAITEKMNLTLDQEQFQFIMTDNKRLLCEATAGSGKTTMSQIKVIREKLFFGAEGGRCLALAYNDHTAKDMEKRHKQLVYDLNSKVSGVNMSDTIICRTFHSNARAWVLEYLNEVGFDKSMVNVNTLLADSAVLHEFMHKALSSAFKFFKVADKVTDTLVNKLIEFSNFSREKMLKVENFSDSQQFRELGLELEVVDKALNNYAFLKDNNMMIDFTDMLQKFYELLRDKEKIRERIQNAYHIVLVDEYQDMTDLMNKCIELMIGENTKLIAIGDGDQAIYGFRGTTAKNCLKFKEYFPDGYTVTMGQNRRCAESILAVAKQVITANTLRYDKDIYTNKEGGTVINHTYRNQGEEYSEIVKELKGRDALALNDVCIAYRNKESSYMLTRHLLRHSIPFRVGSGFAPYSDKLSKIIEETFNLLMRPQNYYYQQQVLYKILPLTHSQVNEVIAHNKQGGNDWKDMDWSKFKNVRGFEKAFNVLVSCEKAFKAKFAMRKYFRYLIGLLRTYYWDWMKVSLHFPEDLEEDILNSYNSDLSYHEFMKEVKVEVERLRNYQKGNIGVYLTTFHGLKGLEFDEVHLTDLKDSVVPILLV
jgi:DNA helicase-2/ATP-dependent DNA helicase PcrA